MTSLRHDMHYASEASNSVEFMNLEITRARGVLEMPSLSALSWAVALTTSGRVDCPIRTELFASLQFAVHTSVPLNHVAPIWRPAASHGKMYVQQQSRIRSVNARLERAGGHKGDSATLETIRRIRNKARLAESIICVIGRSLSARDDTGICCVLVCGALLITILQGIAGGTKEILYS